MPGSRAHAGKNTTEHKCIKFYRVLHYGLEKEEIRRLNVSICSMHSIIQETANFLVLGVSLPILIVPRFITAVVSVWVYNLVSSIGNGLS